MDQVDLSVLIPARNEDMLDRTLQDLCERMERGVDLNERAFLFRELK